MSICPFVQFVVPLCIVKQLGLYTFDRIILRIKKIKINYIHFSLHFGARPGLFRVVTFQGQQMGYVQTKMCSLVVKHACFSCVTRQTCTGQTRYCTHLGILFTPVHPVSCQTVPCPLLLPVGLFAALSKILSKIGWSAGQLE